MGGRICWFTEKSRTPNQQTEQWDINYSIKILSIEELKDHALQIESYITPKIFTIVLYGFGGRF